MKLNHTVSSDLSPVSPLATSFDATVRRYRISARKLSEVTGVSENHISEFRRGKRDVSTTVLFRLLDGMEELFSGSKQYFLQLVSSSDKQSLSVKQSLVEIIQVAEEDELLDAMGAITNKLRHLRSYSASPTLVEAQ